MTDPRLTCPICMHREAGLIPAPRHVSTWNDLTGPEQVAMLAEVGATLCRGTAGFVASSDHDHFHLRDPRASGHGGWFDFVRDMGDPLPERPFATHGRLLRELERPKGLSRAALTGLRDVAAGRQPSEGAPELAFNPHLAQGSDGLRLARPEVSGEFEPLVRELVEWRLGTRTRCILDRGKGDG